MCIMTTNKLKSFFLKVTYLYTNKQTNAITVKVLPSPNYLCHVSRNWSQNQKKNDDLTIKFKLSLWTLHYLIRDIINMSFLTFTQWNYKNRSTFYLMQKTIFRFLLYFIACHNCTEQCNIFLIHTILLFHRFKSIFKS